MIYRPVATGETRENMFVFLTDTINVWLKVDVFESLV
jgi:hypothetical protein